MIDREIESTLFRERAQAIYGPRWKALFAEETGIYRSTVYRWMELTSPIPQWAWVFLAIKGGAG